MAGTTPMHSVCILLFRSSNAMSLDDSLVDDPEHHYSYLNNLKLQLFSSICLMYFIVYFIEWSAIFYCFIKFVMGVSMH